jgi:hypothetical protein
MLTEDHKYREIATALGLYRNTVRRFARADDPGEHLVRDGSGRQPSILGGHADCLRQRWNACCTHGRIVRYADDFVVLVHGTCEDAETLRGEVADVLAPMGRGCRQPRPRSCT